ncbi:MAG: GNAT family N-acetyltransferase [Solobacterium sp.]|nr:GNAT family N-acetyltransferase [Solobacterium sp.]
MIERANEAVTLEVKNIWKKCFTNEDARYIEYFFNNVYQPEYVYVAKEEGQVVASICRIPHAFVFNHRVLQASMISKLAELPEKRKEGYAKELLETVLDACEHTELLTLIQADHPEFYKQYGFESVYTRCCYTLTRENVKRITNYGCAYEPSPLDMLKVYSSFIRRFNGFYARDIDYFVRLKKEITARGGKIVAYYNGKNQIQGYATILLEGKEAKVEECIYLNAMALTKLVNAALQERAIINLHVSEAENLSVLFPDAEKKEYASVMVRLNDYALYARLFNEKIKDVGDAFKISEKPLNLNEFI